MKVILLKETPKLGHVGEIKNVSDGFARNFLIPRGFAAIADDAAVKTLAAKRAEEAKQAEHETGIFRELAKQLQETPLGFTIKVGERGKAFGSVSAEDIRRELATRNITIEKEWLRLEHGLKSTGMHTVPVHFPHNITGELRITIEPSADS